MSRRQLTQKQLSFLEYLRGHVDRHRVWPTYREIADHFEYRSPNSVTQNLEALSKKGFLQRSKNGYALIEQAAREGSVRVRGRLRAGRIEPAPSDRLSLTTLFPDAASLQALELDDETDRAAEFGEARYVFVDEDSAPEGATVVVLDGNRLSLGRIGPDGALEDEGDHDAPRVLGRYAGHAGPYGIVFGRAASVVA